MFLNFRAVLELLKTDLLVIPRRSGGICFYLLLVEIHHYGSSPSRVTASA